MMLFPSVFDDGLFDDFMDFPTVRQSRDDWNHFLTGNMNSYMKTDIKEDGDHYEMDIDLPGYDKDDVSAEDDDGKYLRRERYVGSMSRSFYVGDDMTEKDIKAAFKNGTLSVCVPKKEEKKQVPEKHLIAIEG